MSQQNLNTARVNYNDFYFRIALCAVASHIIVIYNEPRAFFELVFTVSYIRAFFGSFFIALLLTWLIHFVTVRLDSRYDWKKDTLQRLFWQTMLGFITPSIFAFLLAALFFAVFGVNILHTNYLRQDYTVVVLMLLVLNIFYFGVNSFLLRGAAPAQELTTPILHPPKQTTASKEVIVIDTTTKSVPVRVSSISYFFILGKSVFLRTSDMATLTESYQVTTSLKDLEDTLDKRLFFRINRQMIVHFDACQYFRAGKNKTLELSLQPLPYPEGLKVPREHERLVIVSEDRVTAFKAWVDR